MLGKLVFILINILGIIQCQYNTQHKHEQQNEHQQQPFNQKTTFYDNQPKTFYDGVFFWINKNYIQNLQNIHKNGRQKKII